jgi:hypothetical protein
MLSSCSIRFVRSGVKDDLMEEAAEVRGKCPV